MSQKKPVLSRRNFLLSVGAERCRELPRRSSRKMRRSRRGRRKDKRATSGYKVSAHIENYYRTTKNVV